MWVSKHAYTLHSTNFRLLLWPSFSHSRISKMPKNLSFCLEFWVFSLSFEYIPWVLSIFLLFFHKVWVFFLEFWVISLRFDFLLMFFDFVAPTQSLSQFNLNRPHLLENTIFDKKCRNFEFSTWVSVSSLSFEFYSPWVFFSNGQWRSLA